MCLHSWYRSVAQLELRIFSVKKMKIDAYINKIKRNLRRTKCYISAR